MAFQFSILHTYYTRVSFFLVIYTVNRDTYTCIRVYLYSIVYLYNNEHSNTTTAKISFSFVSTQKMKLALRTIYILLVFLFVLFFIESKNQHKVGLHVYATQHTNQRAHLFVMHTQFFLCTFIILCGIWHVIRGIFLSFILRVLVFVTAGKNKIKQSHRMRLEVYEYYVIQIHCYINASHICDTKRKRSKKLAK